MADRAGPAGAGLDHAGVSGVLTRSAAVRAVEGALRELYPTRLAAPVEAVRSGPDVVALALAGDTPAALDQPQPEMLRLNFAFCGAEQPGFVNVAVFPQPGPDDVDLRQPWPWPDSSVGHVRAWDLVEHLPDKIFHDERAMARAGVGRDGRDGGAHDRRQRGVPGPHAYLVLEPAQLSVLRGRQSLPRRFAERYGIRASFQVVHEQTDERLDGPRLTIQLRAVKPAADPVSAEGLRFLARSA